MVSLDEHNPADRAGRATVGELRQQRAVLMEVPLLKFFMDAIPVMIMILNLNRQIVLANRHVLDSMDVDDDDLLIGQRPGEARHCIHSQASPEGCGTSEYCGTCGVGKVLADCECQGQSNRECHTTVLDQGREESLDMRIWATRFSIQEVEFFLFVSIDIGNEKRRRALERIFFHDVLNTAGGLKGFAELLKLEAKGNLADLAGIVYDASDNLVTEIQMQKELMAAEHNELVVHPRPIGAREFLETVIKRMEHNEVARDRSIRLIGCQEEIAFVNDPFLLGRVIVNLLKNALEASEPGDTVTLGCRELGEYIDFWVHEPAVMPRDVQLQVFKRSFSTKGPGRGLGTYSVKLLSERYLKGRVTFDSSPENGTTFRLRYPRQLEV